MTKTNESGWKPGTPVEGHNAMSGPDTTTGNRALMLEEPLIFEIGDTETTGVDFEYAGKLALAGVEQPPEPTPMGETTSRLGGFERKGAIGLPGLTEPETVRHYTRLSRQNYAIDLGLFPLGSCTMKHNPRLNEKIARMPGFADVHPLQPVDTVRGALEVINELAFWLVKLTGMHSVAMSPKAGAHGELCGILCIRAALEAKGDAREVILVPESAHGTNPATAAFAGYRIENIPANSDGRVDLDKLKERLGPDVAGVMITNPSTLGLFERDMKAISDAVHEAGGYVYCDGANFNAIVGKVRPGDLGVDAMHINLHKTFSTPHGGGGPGSGPVVLSEALAAYGPLPYTARTKDGVVHLVEEEDAESFAKEHFGGPLKHFGRMTAFHGQMGMFTRALAYILSHGADGLRQVAEDAVLNANYILRSLEDVLDAPFAHSGPCMHEALFSDKGFGEGISTLDLAKALIDEGYHPMTMYFPLVVHGAMLVEPTETESKATLDQFITALRSVAERAKAGDEGMKAAPYYAPRRRLDETQAARKPVLAYKEAVPEASSTGMAAKYGGG
ncbi:aminomethyl-transferring glycine dehydrogenase subunit GcvPB [Sphingomicrobium aestuariivivum]|uniref:aminomethyl-transferring glycine dehydrogenase subunit GcvPB n=1 Tax=Sphingomicrobium aestuariivivum TaxID=1582356 RepID=UPI001FD6B437|nr:aminomethyl-transferring glycine dehydrogenase subunit GcvPB [Sphingomicrobium aestuariivivum]MCJ8190178.1 aminomethyl-transferring glycine dehydrogenase subunit GcvPB [Sphingomicrobium aestuariivivum]